MQIYIITQLKTNIYLKQFICQIFNAVLAGGGGGRGRRSIRPS